MATKEEINKQFEIVNKLAAPYKFAYVEVANDIEFLEKNARFMTKDQMNQLVSNVKKDGFLSQIPFCMKRKKTKKFLVLSGNHRCKSAIKAEQQFIVVQYIDEVDKDKALGIQLSHNAISGQDDMGMLKELYDMIESLEMKEFSAIDEAELSKLDEIPVATINEADITLHEIGFIFHEANLKKVDDIIYALNKNVEDDKKAHKMFAGIGFHKFVEVMTEIKERSNIKNTTVAFIKMLEICETWIKENPHSGENKQVNPQDN